jgi:hypothetical protein
MVCVIGVNSGYQLKAGQLALKGFQLSSCRVGLTAIFTRQDRDQSVPLYATTRSRFLLIFSGRDRQIIFNLF